MNRKKIKIGIIVGGTSPERAVSKQSGEAIYNAVKELGYDTKVIDPAYGTNQPQNVEDYFGDCDIHDLSNENYIKAFNSSYFENVDLAVIALHGKWGEDGAIQALLDLKGLKYTGTGVLGSSLSMDKARSKAMFTHFGVSTPKWLRVTKDVDIETLKMDIYNKINYPCIIKPNDQGSTLGLSKCSGADDVESAIRLASQYSNIILIEEFILGREIAVGIIGEEILPLLEIIPKHEIYDYECKYTDGMSEYIVPAKINDHVTEKLKSQALTAYKSLGCENYGRADFRLNHNDEIFCFEVNTLPGMTSHSLLPKMANAQGIAFPELIDMIIQSAL